MPAVPEILEKIPKRFQYLGLMGVAQINILPLRGPILKQHTSYSVIFFRLNTLKGTALILTAVILVFITLRGTNLQILIPNKYDEHPGIPGEQTSY